MSVNSRWVLKVFTCFSPQFHFCVDILCLVPRNFVLNKWKFSHESFWMITTNSLHIDMGHFGDFDWNLKLLGLSRSGNEPIRTVSETEIGRKWQATIVWDRNFLTHPLFMFIHHVHNARKAVLLLFRDLFSLAPPHKRRAHSKWEEEQ